MQTTGSHWVPLSYGLVSHLSKKLSKFPYANHRQIQAYAKTNAGGLCCLGTNGFNNFWLGIFDTWWETQFLLWWPYYANPTPNVRHISWGLRSLSIEIKKQNNYIFKGPISTSTQWKRTQFSAYMIQYQHSTASFSKSSNSRDHLFWSWRHPHSRPISCLWFIMTMVIVISFAHESKTVPNGLYTWSLNSNSATPNQTEW